MTAARHHADLILCRKQPGIAVGRLCDKCDGKCPVCDSTVLPTRPVHICDECNYSSTLQSASTASTTTGTAASKCVICNAPGTAVAYYCRQCVLMERDRDGCPKIVNLSAARLDMIYERKKFAFKAPLE